MSELPEGRPCRVLSAKAFSEEAPSLLFVQMLFAFSAALATFFLVPRGVSTGEIDIQSDKMSWNTTKKWVWLLALPHQKHTTTCLLAAHLISRVWAIGVRLGVEPQAYCRTYQLKLLARVPIFNPNYLRVSSLAQLRCSSRPLRVMRYLCRDDVACKNSLMLSSVPPAAGQAGWRLEGVLL